MTPTYGWGGGPRDPPKLSPCWCPAVTCDGSQAEGGGREQRPGAVRYQVLAATAGGLLARGVLHGGTYWQGVAESGDRCSD